MSTLVGCDPEVVLVNAQGDPISAIDIVPGSKQKPFIIEGLGSLHPDNVMAEFNTLPHKEFKDFDKNITDVLGILGELVGREGLLLSEKAYAEYDEIDLLDPRSCEAGCVPDKDAYTGKNNPTPRLDRSPMRSAGGHIHIGHDFKDEDDKRKFIRHLDVVMTIPNLSREEKGRRCLYGKAGAYRSKSYGVEYRTPSNFWIWTTELRRLIFDTIHRALKTYRKAAEQGDKVAFAINNHDLEQAKLLLGVV